MNTLNMCNCHSHNNQFSEGRYLQQHVNYSYNGNQMNQCNRHMNQFNPLQNSYSNPRMLHQQHNNNNRFQYPPNRMHLSSCNSSSNISHNTPKNNYLSSSMRVGGGSDKNKIRIQKHNGLPSEILQIERKMNQIEKQSQRIESFNNIFLKKFPTVPRNNLLKNLPRLNSNSLTPMDSMLIPKKMNYSMSKTNNNGLNSIDEELAQLRKEIGYRLARIREKQKLQTDAIQYILEHSGNPNFSSYYMS